MSDRSVNKRARNSLTTFLFEQTQPIFSTVDNEENRLPVIPEPLTEMCDLVSSANNEECRLPVFPEPLTEMCDFDEYVNNLFMPRHEEFSADLTNQVDTSERIEEASFSLADDLLVFSLLFNLPRKGIEYLLNILNKHGVPVPKTAYKLKQAATNINISSLKTNGTDIAYIGIEDNIKYCVQNKLIEFSDTAIHSLKLKINIDGLPLFKSSSVNLWPILMLVEDCHCPLPIALYCGVGKPSLPCLLEKLVHELNSLQTEGFVYESCTFIIQKVTFICDAPARAYIQCIKGHSGYFGCGYCQQEGVYVADRIIFPTFDAPLRTDENYLQVTENNQVAASPLLGIVPLYSAFPPEYMHLVCLGIMRKLCNYYFVTTKGIRLPCKLSALQCDSLSDMITSLQCYIPPEFQRKIRRLKELVHFKATEFRSFLLYFGPYLFKDFLPSAYLHHFNMLHFALYVFVSDRHTHLHNHAARCLENFVRQMSLLFGQQSLIYNTHVLLHLPNYVALYGPLDTFSAFPFENYLSVLKRRIRTNNCVFQHSVNQLMIIRALFTKDYCMPSVPKFSENAPNNCTLLNNGVYVLITSLHSDGHVSGTKLVFYQDLYTLPYASSTLGIGFFKRSNIIVSHVLPSVKVICVPVENHFLIIPFA